MTCPRAEDPHLAAALRQLEFVRRFRQIEVDRRRLDRELGDLLGHLTGLITYHRPRRPDFLTFGCASGAPLSPLVAGVDGRGVC